MSRAAWVFLVLLLLALLPACSSSRYSSLKNEHDQSLYDKDDEHACLCHELAGCHVSTRLIPTHGSTGTPVRIATYELGPADTDPIIFIHGVFADHESWRFITPLLAREHRLILLDLPGCGSSDAPDPTPENEADLYSPTGMAARLAEALDTVLADSSPRRAMIVAHSLGGFVALRMFADPAIRAAHPALLQRVDRMVLIAPLDGVMEKADPAFLAIAKLSGFDVSVGLAFGVVQDKVTDVVLKSVDESSDALRAEADKRIEILQDPPRRRALQSMLRQVVPMHPSDTEFRPDWDRMLPQAAQNHNVEQPCLILWGERDEVMPMSMGYRLWATLPWAELRVFARCRHSPQIEEPAACATMIEDFLALRDPCSTLARAAAPAKAIDVKSTARLVPRHRTPTPVVPEPTIGGR